jgi:hypothetical protein
MKDCTIRIFHCWNTLRRKENRIVVLLTGCVCDISMAIERKFYFNNPQFSLLLYTTHSIFQCFPSYPLFLVEFVPSGFWTHAGRCSMPMLDEVWFVCMVTFMLTLRNSIFFTTRCLACTTKAKDGTSPSVMELHWDLDSACFLASKPQLHSLLSNSVSAAAPFGFSKALSLISTFQTQFSKHCLKD